MKLFFHGNTAARPGDMLLLYGDGLDKVESVRIGRLPDDRGDRPGFIAFDTPVSVPTEEEIRLSRTPVRGESEADAEFYQKCNESVKVVIPEELAFGVYTVTLTDDLGESLTVYINVPVIQWVQGDEGKIATPGKRIRINGEMLSPEGKAPTVIAEKDGEYTELSVTRVYDDYSIEAALPEEIEEGEYTLWLYNGFGDGSAWSCPRYMTVGKLPERNETVFNIVEYGADKLGMEDSTDVFRRVFELVSENGAVSYTCREDASSSPSRSRSRTAPRFAANRENARKCSGLRLNMRSEISLTHSFRESAILRWKT